METWETLWRFAVTGLAVWRFSHLLIDGRRGAHAAAVPLAAPDESAGMCFWSGRAMDLVCWVGVWMSSRTAIWVTCGLAGVILSWLAASAMCRLFVPEAETDRESSAPSYGDKARAING